MTPSFLAKLVARTTESHGVDITLAGKTMKVATKTVPSGEAGLQLPDLPRSGGYAARSDTRAFGIPAALLAPYTNVARPVEGSSLLYAGAAYLLTHVKVEQDACRDVTVRAFGHRVLMLSQISDADRAWLPAGAMTPEAMIFDTEVCQLWRPKALAQMVNSDTRSLKDLTFENVGDWVAFFDPMRPAEKMTMLGQMDVRMDHVFTNEPLRLGDVLYRPALDEAWLVSSPSETQPGTGLILGVARHIQPVPKSIRAGQS